MSFYIDEDAYSILWRTTNKHISGAAEKKKKKQKQIDWTTDPLSARCVRCVFSNIYLLYQSSRTRNHRTWTRTLPICVVYRRWFTNQWTHWEPEIHPNLLCAKWCGMCSKLFNSIRSISHIYSTLKCFCKITNFNFENRISSCDAYAYYAHGPETVVNSNKKKTPIKRISKNRKINVQRIEMIAQQHAQQQQQQKTHSHDNNNSSSRSNIS